MWPRDWSSDVCSSDLMPGKGFPSTYSSEAPPPVEMWRILLAKPALFTAATESPPPTTVYPGSAEIGSASCREREENPGSAQSTRTRIQCRYEREEQST